VQVFFKTGPCGYGFYRQLVEDGVECMVCAPSLIPWKHSKPVPGPALAEKQRCGMPVNGSAAMTDTAMVHACGVPAAG
jgi:hypothetical protein